MIFERIKVVTRIRQNFLTIHDDSKIIRELDTRVGIIANFFLKSIDVNGP